ncbi:molybdenum cofactor biosynthesis protein MoaE [Parvularcula sp. IMCC14364]|uniref:molybdenum cofactor biosynthesis protein MoaE n=1 Tax=Parvularcula sp. IMCC14364 TaxID=3067902 RepID=UPI002741F2D6|nr:molybdenum cofactor biosynthesis protein MoaE [Parvularcula sp. IMCC14364]
MFSLLKQNFNAATELSLFLSEADGRGATTSFIGTVRGKEQKQEVNALFIEHHPVLTEKSIREIIMQACNRWRLLRYLVLHRIGTIHSGEDIVLVATTATHRRDAFEAVDFIMDYLKADALFWKKQITETGAEWIEPRAQDYQDKKRWRDNAGY